MGERDGQLAAVSENFESSLDAVAETLFEPAEDTPASKSEAPKRVAEGEDFVDENDVDNSVDLEDIDLLEGEEVDEEEVEEAAEIDPEEVEYDVVVDGETRKAKLKELKSAYSGNKAIDKRVQEASEMRKQSEVMATELMKQLNVQATKLKQLDEILAQAEGPGVDWETLRRTDPQRYLIEKDKQQELQNNRRIVQQKMLETQQQQHELNQRKLAEIASREAETLMQKIPDLRNPEKAKKMGESWSKTGREYGFNDEEIGGIVDHRMLLVLTDAMKYRALVAAKAARQGKNGGAMRSTPKPLLRPGSQNFGQKMNAVRAEKEAAAKASRTGSLEDVAATLLVSAKRSGPKRTGF